MSTQREQIDASMQQERIIAALTASFGVLALVLASVGVYGVMAYSVAQRTSEIGIRMALGALPREVLTMVLREATWIALVGIACGIAATLLSTRLVTSLLYGLHPNDPVILATSATAANGRRTGRKLGSRSPRRVVRAYRGFETRMIEKQSRPRKGSTSEMTWPHKPNPNAAESDLRKTERVRVHDSWVALSSGYR